MLGSCNGSLLGVLASDATDPTSDWHRERFLVAIVVCDVGRLLLRTAGTHL